jgi:hypothetical protein
MLKPARLSFQGGIYVGLLHSRRAVALFFAISLSLLALAQAAKILAKQDPPVVQAGDDATLLDGNGLYGTFHVRLHKESLNRFKKPWPKFGRL